jgi:hypothetical protein
MDVCIYIYMGSLHGSEFWGTALVTLAENHGVQRASLLCGPRVDDIALRTALAFVHESIHISELSKNTICSTARTVTDQFHLQRLPVRITKQNQAEDRDQTQNRRDRLSTTERSGNGRSAQHD